MVTNQYVMEIGTLRGFDVKDSRTPSGSVFLCFRAISPNRREGIGVVSRSIRNLIGIGLYVFLHADIVIFKVERGTAQRSTGNNPFAFAGADLGAT